MIQLDLLLKCHGQTPTYKYFNEQSKTADCDFNLSTCRYHYPYPIKDFQVFDFTWAYNMQSSHILRGHWCLNVVALPCPSIKVDKGWRMFHEIDANKLFFNEFLNIWFVSRKKISFVWNTGDFMKRFLPLPVCTRDRKKECLNWISVHSRNILYEISCMY